MVQALSVLFGEIQFWNQEAYKLCFASVRRSPLGTVRFFLSPGLLSGFSKAAPER